uniref:MFS-type transporter SLC18B1 isoform X2 n=1 Tax=Geotrypetes seraphini TaxID=260995 RepID=A0A6P8R4C4_GEOSA|nr:MFS-type transporter SLC18B1 isoform X2 [Geotrypetes seraphini]
MGSQEGTGRDPGSEIVDHDEEDVLADESRKFSREQIFTLISTASINFSSMICYSILGPFFPQEAVRKGVSNTIIGLIFGCFALFNFLTSLILGKYLVHIGAKFMFVTGMFVCGSATIIFGMLNKAPNGPIFIALCFIVRSVDAIGFGAAMTASFSILAKTFPNNVATVLGSLEIFTGLGLVLGPPVGGFLYQSFGYETPFIAVGCVVLMLVPLNIWILPRYDTFPGKESFWKLITLPKVVFLCGVIFSLSSCLGFLDPTLSLFVTRTFNLPVGYVGLVFLGLALSYSLSSPLLGIISDKKPKLRKWLLIIGNLGTAICFFFLGPAPIFHLKSQLWLFVLMLVLNGFYLGLSAIPIFPEMLECAYKHGFEEGLSTLGLISGLFSAMWSVGSFVGPTLGGFLNEKFHFQWAAAIQGLLVLIIGLMVATFYIVEAIQARRSCLQNIDNADSEQTPLIPESSIHENSR